MVRQFSVTEHDQNELFSAHILSKNPVKSRVRGMDHMNPLIFRHSLKFDAEKALFQGYFSDHVNIWYDGINKASLS